MSIPDKKFLNALIAAGVDTNNDDTIQVSEAAIITSLSLSQQSISDLTGIEAFTNLSSLMCPFNFSLNKLDVSKNTQLQYFDCGGSIYLTSLDVSKNVNLISLDIIGTGIKTLDLSSNLQLQTLLCNGTFYNGLTVNNQLTLLDVSKNSMLQNLNAEMNPQLKSICVSSNQYANDVAGWTKDSTCQWDTVCTSSLPATAVIEVKNVSSKPTLIACYDILGNRLDLNELHLHTGVIIFQYSDGRFRKILRIE